MSFLKTLFGKKKPSAQECYERALICEQAADHEGAISALDEAIRLDREFCDAFWVRGLLHEISEDYDQALADLRRAQELKPPSLDCLTLDFAQKPVRVLRTGPRFTDPRALALKNRAIDNEISRIYRTQGNACYDQRKFGEAIAFFAQALEHNREYQNYFERGRAYFCLRKFKEAIADLEQAVACAPLDDTERLPSNGKVFSGGEQLGACHYFLGNAYQEIGDFERAVVSLTNSIRWVPDNPDTYNDRARAYRALGDCERAAEDERKARE